jgi:4-hydroxyphenylacetate 3-monooxygenase
MLRSGDDYKASLRDGRVVLAADGSRVEDVTTHGQFRDAIDTVAALYEMQLRPETQDIATYKDEESGELASRAWQVPRTKDDLVARRELAGLSTYHTFGVFGRPPDYGSFNALGLLSVADRIAQSSDEWAENIDRFIAWGRSTNAMSADIVADVQSDRSVPTALKPGRLRCVEERKDGLVLYGAKPCASGAVHAHVGTIVTLLTPGADPNANVFCSVPLNAPGLTLVAREPVVNSGTAMSDHPLERQGEEPDSLLVFDRVFVPREEVFSFRDENMLGLYHELGALALWHILARLSYKAEIFAGAAQVIVEILGTENIPQVRDAVSEITAYATTLRAFVLAAEDTAALANGVLVPSERFVTAGRLHSVEGYPRVLQLMREISGQGLISRFSQRQLDDAAVGEMLREFLPGTGVSAEAKNRVFNFVWDLTCSANALRVALFENVNATPPAAMRARIYGSPYRRPWRDFVLEHLGVDIRPTR